VGEGQGRRVEGRSKAVRSGEQRIDDLDLGERRRSSWPRSGWGDRCLPSFLNPIRENRERGKKDSGRSAEPFSSWEHNLTAVPTNRKNEPGKEGQKVLVRRRCREPWALMETLRIDLRTNRLKVIGAMIAIFGEDLAEVGVNRTGRRRKKLLSKGRGACAEAFNESKEGGIW